ncbi:glycoside hydrolase family 2 protein [Mucilaginibacter aquatilis]|uniref:Beta-glucuronidase n=1 Tax=Mucilaginibacter aquatilis TaxID=1517760 RepID=A0A6I4I915_9SPHI|nr:glycoside hydrolase family 2 TIM barrel-domain containing protein [Mucilaginibacter aquatilis]MVN91745.1 glycoside hydrolase family 2 [Mucilaginibacter aquatilis]
MTKKIFFTIALALLLVNSSEVLAQATLRKSFNLNGKWNVIVDWYGSGNAHDIATQKRPVTKTDFVEFSFDNSQTLYVPGDWNSQRPELKYYEGTVWYKREFDFKPQTNAQTFLRFGAVSYRSEIFLNGIKLGEHEGGFTSFTLNAARAIKTGHNVLVVKVNNERKEDAIPARKFDWWNYGGITRGVWIDEKPANHISDFFIQLKKGSLKELQGFVQTSEHKKQQVIVAIPEAGFKKSYTTDTSGKVALTASVSLKLWSPENPKLYTVKVYNAADTLTDEIGFRSIEVQGTDILLNKKPVFLRGISFHEEMPQRSGRAYGEADARTLLTWAKELGCNFVRLAHYPQSEETVRLAEKMGLMMWEEIPVWQGIQFTNPQILQKANHMLAEMIARDKNRCGIVIWSLSNETAPSPHRNSVLKQMASDARKADPTRLISSAFDHFKYNGNQILIDDPLSESLDVLAANKYMGWYAKWPSEPGNVEWKSNFNKPLIISEFGAEALYGNHGSKDTAGLWTEEYQEQLYKDNINMFNKISFLRGVCPWILADFKSPARMHAQCQEGWNRKGLLSDKGFKKRAWYIMNDYYKQLEAKPLQVKNK